MDIDSLKKKVDETIKMIPAMQGHLDQMRNDLAQYMVSKKITEYHHLEDLEYRLTKLRDSMDDFISGG